MELTEIQIYFTLIAGTAASVGFGISGLKFINRKWVEAIEGHVEKKIEPILSCCEENKVEVDKLKTRFEDFWGYLKK